MKKRKDSAILGVSVTSRAVHAVLVAEGEDGPEIVNHFVRQRSTRFAGSQQGLPMGAPAFQESINEGDISVQFGQGINTQDLFFSSEFSGFDAGVGGDGSSAEAATQQVATFALELADIISACEAAGYEDPTVVFTLGATDLTQVELAGHVDEKKRKSEDASSEKVPTLSQKQWMELLKAQHQGVVDAQRLAFLPMTASDSGMPRTLALMPDASDSITATLQAMRKQKGHQLPTVRLLDTEVSLYLGLARAAFDLDTPANADKYTLVVRAGAEGTLVLFAKGDTLMQSENLRSLTAFDAPETICSRVLLQQDEHGIVDVDYVLLLSEDQEAEVVESFRMFFPDAQLEPMVRVLPSMLAITEQHAPYVPALAATLRMLEDERYTGVFEAVNLLPRELTRRRIKLPITWHAAVLCVLLFFTVFFFTARYFSLQGEINTYKYRVAVQDPQVSVENLDPQVLQARIDSLRHVHDSYVRALDVLDSLLVGSDQWSRSLEEITAATSKVTGLWIDSYAPTGGRLQITGNATSRGRIVDFADRTKGEIVSLTFSEIREWPVYSFEMTLPRHIEMPEAARYLREHLTQEVAEATETPASEAVAAAPAEVPVRPVSLDD